MPALARPPHGMPTPTDSCVSSWHLVRPSTQSSAMPFRSRSAARPAPASRRWTPAPATPPHGTPGRKLREHFLRRTRRGDIRIDRCMSAASSPRSGASHVMASRRLTPAPESDGLGPRIAQIRLRRRRSRSRRERVHPHRRSSPRNARFQLGHFTSRLSEALATCRGDHPTVGYQARDSRRVVNGPRDALRRGRRLPAR